MAKTRIITARLKFSPGKHGQDMTEAELADYLGEQLNFADCLDVETVADRDPIPAILAALKAVVDWYGAPPHQDAPAIAKARAAIAAAEGRADG